jgi:hypothetical protein
MREDMSKVVIERPRYGHSLPSAKTKLRIKHYDEESEYDDQPSRVTAARLRYKSGRKAFSDLLGPLRRYLRSNVGRPWDKVYSEMKQHLDDRKTTGRHIFQHAEDYVSVNCFYDEDGELWVERWFGRIEPISQAYRLRDRYYVDPHTRLLCLFDPNDKAVCRRKYEARKRQARRTLERIQINYNQSYVRINGEWFIGDYVQEDAPKAAECEPLIERGLGYFAGARWMRLVSKRKCSQQELQRAGLNLGTHASSVLSFGR